MRRLPSSKREMRERAMPRKATTLGAEFAVASLLIEARTRAKLSQLELAKKTGTSQPMIARLESGSSKPSLSTLERFATATGMRMRIVFELAQVAKKRRSRRAA